MVLGGGENEEEGGSGDSKPRLDGTREEETSCKSFDVKLELGNGSDSSLSSGVGSSLSTDPPADSIKNIVSRRGLDASNSSLSSASASVLPLPEENKPRKKLIPQLTCRQVHVVKYSVRNQVFHVLFVLRMEPPLGRCQCS